MVEDSGDHYNCNYIYHLKLSYRLGVNMYIHIGLLFIINPVLLSIFVNIVERTCLQRKTLTMLTTDCNDVYSLMFKIKYTV